ncbi:MAG: hypothetical protein ABI690_04620 [Chloroflexota bacterium]
MAANTKNEAAIPNPALESFSILVGEWDTVGTHPLLPGTLHGHTSFEWIEGGAFLRMVSEIEEPRVPTTIAIFGSDNVLETYFMLTFDERGISRKHDMTLSDKTWKWWRNAPKFSQRFTGTFADDGNTIIGVSELCEDDVTWKRDLALTYTRVK